MERQSKCVGTQIFLAFLIKALVPSQGPETDDYFPSAPLPNIIRYEFEV